MVPKDTPGAQFARLLFTVRGRHEGLTWLELRPHTGRKHQLRVQLASRGCPIYGDAKYGSDHPFGHAIALHARSLTFLHPTTQEPITVKADVPKLWRGRFAHLLASEQRRKPAVSTDMTTDEKLAAILAAVQTDPGNRGLARDPDDNLFTATQGDFAGRVPEYRRASARQRWHRDTGFFIPIGRSARIRNRRPARCGLPCAGITDPLGCHLDSVLDPASR